MSHQEQTVVVLGGEGDEIVNEGDEIAFSTVAEAVAAVGVIAWKVSVGGDIRELSFQ